MRCKRWFKAEWLMLRVRFGRWAYMIAGVAIGFVLVSGVVVASEIVDQGMPGKYGSWPVKATMLSPDGGVGTLPVVLPGFTTLRTSETLVGVGPTTMPLASGTKSQVFENLGPDPIYCSNTINGSNNADAGLADAGAFLAAGGVSIPSGASATFDTTLQMYCVSTVLQTAGLGTRVVDLDAVNAARLSAAGATVITTARDGGVPATLPVPWEYGSAACFVMDVNSAGPDGGVLLAPDGGVPTTGVLYRCVNPSGSVGDLCYKSGTFLASCTSASAVRVVPGAELHTKLTQPVYGQSSSGAARLECCPVAW